ncbi:DNA polymerase III subunit beta [Geobacter sp. DSM 9736]|uniref:DNA polymerase III subunit beta n=1 Tax=Geobacter sp. DSM 9736 TaxID=1277350 RepID=UPI000B50EE74|nr:DNA polymerase III subunit beta [Geobacter sp. DSM 9736]SNB47283.1 DNA polymerase III, beta subunit [Geobacter sp. DSM 9736]
MEFRIDKETFLKALQKVQGIVEKKNTMPILSNVLIEALEDRLYITATDLEVGMRSSYPVNVVREGKITVSAKKIYEIIKELSEEEIHFSTKENDWVDLRSGKARFNIVGLSPDEFPYFPRVNEENFVHLSNVIISDMVEKTAYAMCNDETKYNLNGIFVKALEDDGRKLLRMVATDGHRLCIAEREFTGSITQELGKGVIFPKKGILELKKLTEDENEDILLGFMDNSAVLKKENTVIVMRLVDGEFPDYTKVIPQNNTRIVTIRREQFLHSLKRMAILSSEKFKGIKFDIAAGGLEISSSNPELGDAREEIEVEYAGEPMTSRFNARYLIDVLVVLGEESVELKLKDEMSPAIIKPGGSDDFMSVVMPMRL